MECSRRCRAKKEVLFSSSREAWSIKALSTARAGFSDEASKLGLKVAVVQAEWKRDRAQELVTSAVSRGQIDGIFANNDDMALGAVAGIRAANLPKSRWPVVIGFDATRDGLGVRPRNNQGQGTGADAARGSSGFVRA